ncbi:MAG: efflux RND transporter permease subunit [Firmicutes bacterium]|nr:efflux RND transporter permease subunit [Bacillota bacterium]
MSLTDLALRRRVSVFLLVLAIAVFGVLAITGMSMELMPDIDMPMQIVISTYPGADPESVEELLTKPIEKATAVLSGVDSVMSYSLNNLSMVMITYDYNTDMNGAYIDLRAALDGAGFDLPEEASEPVVMELNIDALPTVEVAAVASGTTDLLGFIEDELVPEMESLGSVADVKVTGGDENYIRVTLNEEMMHQFGLTVSSIAQYIAAMDFTVPAGSVTQGSRDSSVSLSGDITSAAAVRDIPLITGTGALITLGDVAEVVMSTKEASSISRYNGNDCVLVDITKRQSASTVNTAREIFRALDKLSAQNEAIEYVTIYDGADIVMQALRQVGNTLLLGVVLAMLVLFVFFGDIRASLIVGSSIPLSLLLTLALMDLLDFSLNVVTAIALVVAIGMVVDSSIVVIESCFRASDSLEDTQQAASTGAANVRAAIIASCATTVVVYLPMLFMKGMSSMMFSEFCWIVIITLLASLLTALTLVPLCFTVLKPRERKQLPVSRFLRRVNAAYDRLMRRLMPKRGLVLAVSLALLLGSGALLMTMNTELIPEVDEGNISIKCQFQSGTRLEVMEEKVAFIEELLAADDNFEFYSMTIGGSGLDAVNGASTATFTAYRAEGSKRSAAESVEKYAAALNSATDMDVSVSSYSSLSYLTSFMDSTTVTLEGTDLDELRRAAEQVETEAAAIPGVIHVASDAGEASTYLKLDVDPLLAMNVGLVPASVAAEVYYTLSGMEAATVTSGGEEYSIMLEYPKGAYSDVNALLDKRLSTPYNTTVALSDIASVSYEREMPTRTRVDGKYQVEVSIDAQSAYRNDVKSALSDLCDGLELPETVNVVSSTVEDMTNEELVKMFRAILIALFLVFLVMAMQFESVRFSLLVMVCVPFALIGSFLILRIGSSDLSLVSLLGFLMLEGIVVNNAILLVDTANVLREAGLSAEDALIASGQVRLRPILMTTLTTVLAMVPLLFAGGMAAMLRGIAQVVIGGMVASTVLVLILLPTFYLIMDKKRQDDSGEPAAPDRQRLEQIMGKIV